MELLLMSELTHAKHVVLWWNCDETPAGSVKASAEILSEASGKKPAGLSCLSDQGICSFMMS